MATSTKKIKPVDLSARKIEPRFGQSFKPFTIYEVYGSDGSKYETNDRKYFDTFSIGVDADIQYAVEVKRKGNREFKSLKLISPVLEAPKNVGMEQKMDEILGLLRVMASSHLQVKTRDLGEAEAREKERKGYVYPKEDLHPDFDKAHAEMKQREFDESQIVYPEDDDNREPSPNY